MPLGVMGKKIGMTQVFTEQGKALPATVINVEPNVVVQIKTVENDGYNALQLGYEKIKESKASQPAKGHFAKAGVSPRRFLSEYKVAKPNHYQVGQEIGVGIFKDVSEVTVRGRSKGKGFQGVVKRWNFSGGPASHGSRFKRRPGSIGSIAGTGRVFKGKKMPGRTGNRRVSISGLKVLKVDEGRNLLVVKGSVPGPKGNLLEIIKSNGNH